MVFFLFRLQTRMLLDSCCLYIFISLYLYISQLIWNHFHPFVVSISIHILFVYAFVCPFLCYIKTQFWLTLIFPRRALEISYSVLELKIRLISTDISTRRYRCHEWHEIWTRHVFVDVHENMILELSSQRNHQYLAINSQSDNHGEVGQTLTFGYSHVDIQTFRLTFGYWHPGIQTFRCWPRSDINIQTFGHSNAKITSEFYRALGLRNFTTCSPYTKHGTTRGLSQFLEFSLYGDAYSRNLGL